MISYLAPQTPSNNHWLDWDASIGGGDMRHSCLMIGRGISMMKGCVTPKLYMCMAHDHRLKAERRCKRHPFAQARIANINGFMVYESHSSSSYFIFSTFHFLAQQIQFATVSYTTAT